MSAPEYNASMPDGGDPTQIDVNAIYDGVGYHAVWVMAATAIIFPIIPGIGLLYGGLARRKASLALLWQSFLVASVGSIQWWFIGYTLTYSRSAGKFIGDFANIGFRNVSAAPSVGSGYIPEVLYAIFQCLFAVCTVQIMIGGAFERGKLLPTLIFAFIWETIVYAPVACWVWNPSGWLFQLPSLDFAGGGPVHISSGFSALAYAFVLGKRTEPGQGHKHRHRPHNVSMVFLGTTLIWFGWFGFNGGSTLNATVRSMYTMWNTQLAACSGIAGWVLVDYFKKKGKLSVVGACEGAIAGLVGITPAAGYVAAWYAAVIGFLTACTCALMEDVCDWLNIDEGLDVFKLHGLGGAVGAFLTGIFASNSISMLDGATSAPGAVDGDGAQVARQLAAIAAISSYSFVVSAALLFGMKLLGRFVPILDIRATEDAEILGLDAHEFHMEEVGDWSAGSERLDNILGFSQSATETPRSGIKS